MAITDYGSLKRAVAGYLHRDDLAPAIADYIQLAEARLNRDLNLPGERGDRSIVLDRGESRLTLPSDFHRFLSLWRGAVVVPFEVPVRRWSDFKGTWSSPVRKTPPVESDSAMGEPPRRLRYVNDVDFAVRQTPGEARRFTLMGRWLVFACPAAKPRRYRLHYERAFALSEESPTNYLLEHHPDAYLYATLLEAPVWSFDDDRLVVYQDRYDRAIASIRGHMSGAWGDDVMRMDFGDEGGFSILEG
ncbi:MAG: hypothetical protein AB2690_06415 [Candidatus Thiodiazotropha endolucinida]